MSLTAAIVPLIAILLFLQMAIKAVAAWEEANSGMTTIKAARGSVSGTVITWSTPETLSAGGSISLNARVAISSDGSTAIVVWQAFEGSTYLIKSAIVLTSQAEAPYFGSAVQISATESPIEPIVALSSDGQGAVAVWKAMTVLIIEQELL